jgi:pimeloyl-ACP methyl ester carboxylesterase
MPTETEPQPDTTPPPRRTRKRWVRRTGIALGVVLLLFYGGIGWMFSSKIQNDAFEVEAPGEPEYEVEVVGFDGDNIILSLESDNHHLLEPGIRGVAWPGGYGRVGAIQAETTDTVTRTYIPADGTPPTGTLLDMDGFAYPQDPLAAHGLPFEDVTYPSELGPLSAWNVAGSTDSWVVFVHGKTAPQREGLRIIPPLHAAGYHVLVVTYRNDVGMPSDPSGAYGYGETEWPDVAAAVSYAQQQGAADIALVGYSMGGAIVTSFMINSPAAADIDAVVLDAPMLDFSATVDLGARHTSLPVIGLPVPQSLTNVAKVLAGWRFGIDWPAIDYFDEVGEINTPILLFHGTEDERVPIETSERLAEERPEIVQLEIFEDAGHILSWNVDRARYERLLTEFLAANLG